MNVSLTFSCLRMRVIVATALMPLAATVAHASTITVDSTADITANDGHCTLREAIDSANNNVASGGMAGECAAGQVPPTVDVIAFAIPGGGVHTITPASTLIISQPVRIDGYTQAGSSVNTLAVGDNAILAIEIAGGSLDGVIQLDGPFSVGDASGSTIRGLVLSKNGPGRGIFVGAGFGNGSNNTTIVGNFLGVDPTGMTAAASDVMINAVSSAGLLVGGASPADRNVIVAANNSPISLNQVTASSIQGNLIGVNAAGSASLGAEDGILLEQGSNNVTIGGPLAGQGNVVYGSFHAISIRNSDGAIVQRNLIGTDASGTTALRPEVGIGIESSSGTLIGGSDAGVGNVISGNVVGIQVGNSSPGTIIQGNHIGTGSDGVRAIANSSSGILITGGNAAAGSSIGGTNPGEGNIIANSCRTGIEFNQPATDWPILGNSIYASTLLGISLRAGQGPTPNDPGDADTGANQLQNYPVLTSATVLAGGVSFAGTLDSTANTSYRIEMFSGVDCHASGFGEGQTLLGSFDVNTDASGNGAFASSFGGVPAGQTAISATATDPDGNTSEFSMCLGGIGRVFANGFEPACGS